MKIQKTLLFTAGAATLATALSFSRKSAEMKLPEAVIAHSGLIRTDSNFTYRDLNKNGRLDIYEDPRQPIEKRVQDLLSQMNSEEKAGMMFYSPTSVNKDGTIEE